MRKKTKYIFGSRILWSLQQGHLGMYWVLSQLTWHSTSGWESVELCTHLWIAATGQTTACSTSKISKQLCQFTTGGQRWWHHLLQERSHSAQLENCIARINGSWCHQMVPPSNGISWWKKVTWDVECTITLINWSEKIAKSISYQAMVMVSHPNTRSTHHPGKKVPSIWLGHGKSKSMVDKLN